MNACETAGLKFLSPYNVMRLNGPIDLNRIRNGESKYIVRDLFKKLYPDIIPNKKIPMPRPMELWLKNWGGPKRKEFKNTSLANLSGDAKWLVYILEKFLNYYDVGE